MSFIFSKTKKICKYELQLSIEITFDSGIETTIIIYQIEARIKLHNMFWSRPGKSFLYPNYIVYITYRVFNVFDAPFSIYLLLFQFKRAIQEILVLIQGFLFIFQSVSILQKKIREKKKKEDVVHIFKNKKTFGKYELQLSMEITFDSGIETTIIIYQFEARIKLHNMHWSRGENRFVPK